MQNKIWNAECFVYFIYVSSHTCNYKRSYQYSWCRLLSVGVLVHLCIQILIIHNFFFCNRNHFNSVVSFSICTITILYLPCTCNIIRQGKMSKSEYKQLVQILYYNDAKFLLLHYTSICISMSVLVRTALFLLLQSYTVQWLVYNLIFVSSLSEFGSYSLTPHQVRHQQRTL